MMNIISVISIVAFAVAFATLASFAMSQYGPKTVGGTALAVAIAVGIGFLMWWALIPFVETDNQIAKWLLSALPWIASAIVGGIVVESFLNFREKLCEAELDGEHITDEQANEQWNNLHNAKMITIAVEVIVIIAAVVFFCLTTFYGSDTAVKAEAAEAQQETAVVEKQADERQVAEKSAKKAKADEVSKEELEKAVKQLTVKKVTADELEQLTTMKKYRDVSDVLLESSLTSKDAERVKATGFSDALTFGFSGKDDTVKIEELEEEILRNPVYGVTVAKSIMNKKIGDKPIKTFNKWMSEMVKPNKKHGVSYWLETRGDDTDTFYVTNKYRCYAATLCTWLERLVCQSVQTRQTIENWCLNDAALNNDRAGIKASYQYAKEALVLSYIGKNRVELFTIGFNIHDKRPEFYGEEEPVNPTPEPTTTPTINPEPVNPTPGPSPEPTPEPKPEPTPTPKPTPEPTPEPKPEPTPTPKPTPTVTPEPSRDKDPDDAPSENTEPNDDPGPGPDTNNPADPQHSTEDKPHNSDHYPSYEDYRNDVEDTEETNQNQKTDRDANTPSTPKPSADTQVDNNTDDSGKSEYVAPETVKDDSVSDGVVSGI